jgi:hypothetical protein
VPWRELAALWVLVIGTLLLATAMLDNVAGIVVVRNAGGLMLILFATAAFSPQPLDLVVTNEDGVPVRRHASGLRMSLGRRRRGSSVETSVSTSSSISSGGGGLLSRRGSARVSEEANCNSGTASDSDGDGVGDVNATDLLDRFNLDELEDPFVPTKPTRRSSSVDPTSPY